MWNEFYQWLRLNKAGVIGDYYWKLKEYQNSDDRRRVQRQIMEEFKNWTRKKKRGMKRQSDDNRRRRQRTDQQENPDVKKTEPPVTDDPGEPKRMPGYTSHSSVHCCVDLGTLNVARGMKKDSKIPREVQLGSKKMSYTISDIFSTSTNNQIFTVLFPASNSTNPPTTATRMTAGLAAGMNSVYQCDYASSTTNFLETTYNPPTYAGGGVGVSDLNNGNRGILLKDQYVELKFKNISLTDVPCYFTVYACRLKDDVLQKWDQDSTHNNKPLLAEFIEGFTEKYDSGTPFTAPTRDTTQKYGVSIRDNAFIDKHVDILDSKKHCLSVGQEGTMRIFHKGKQWNNFHYHGRGQAYGGLATEYLLPAAKAGEIFFVLCVHGGVSAGTAAAVPRVEIEACRLGCFATVQWTAVEVELSKKGQKANYAVLTANDVNADIDIENYYK